jgi:DNA mismatch repair protein MutS
MEIDQTTLSDLAIFSHDDESSVFNRLNFTQSIGGRDQLRYILSHPLSDIRAIRDVQETLQYILKHEAQWPSRVSNGTIMVVERFYDTSFDTIPKGDSALAALFYKIFHGPDYSLVMYSAIHCFDLIKGLQQFVARFLTDHTPAPMKAVLKEIQQKVTGKPLFDLVAGHERASELKLAQLLGLGGFMRDHFKANTLYLIELFYKLDAWYGMAMAVKKYQLVFPVLVTDKKPMIAAKGLFHLLVEAPVAYDVQLDRQSNFLFLTGANMAGKSTFIKAVGTAVFLAHSGMGVPAQSMSLSLFDGLLSNINVADNLVKGESYFYNEVQRIKATVNKVNDGKNWLILIDELFKGTNVQDAMKCSSSVIEGLLKINHSIFILSTHLYEIGEALKRYPNICFRYFETTVVGDQLRFSYQLKDGISNDRLGYLILKMEGVVELLDSL